MLYVINDKTILGRIIACSLLNIGSLNNDFTSDFFLSAFQFAGREKSFSKENKELITDTYNSLLSINKSCQRVCFTRFFKEILKISRQAVRDIEDRVSNSESVVYEQGEISRAAQNRSNKNTNSILLNKKLISEENS